MPDYKFRAPDGAVFTLRGDSPPTEQELEQVYASLPSTGKVSGTGVLPEPTAAEKASAVGIGALEAIGRWPGELATTAGQAAANQILPPFARQALNLVVPGSEKVLNQAIDQSIAGYTSPIQNLTPKAFNALGNLGGLISQDVQYNDPNSPQIRSPGYAAAGEFIPNLFSLLVKGPTGVRPATTIGEVGSEAASMASSAAKQLPRAIEDVVGGVLGKTSSTAAPERLFRAAIKPSKAVGQKVETAAKNTISDVFHANPEADKIAATPFEGFELTVREVKKNVGTELDAGLRQAGFNGNAGDEMAAAINQRADRLQKAGRPAEDVQYLRDRADDYRGQVTDMESLRDAVTLANQELTPLFTKTREISNPKFAQADNILNQTVSKVGGDFENKALESLKGPDGAVLRKKWSDLSTLEREASGRLNKLLNEAPAEARPALVEALSTPAGAGAAIGLSFGKLSAAIPLISSVAKAYSRKLAKELKDSNVLITRAYEKLRANPPPRPSVSPPFLPGTTPPIIPNSPTVSGIQVPPPNLEALIQRRMNELNIPSKTRNQGLARMGVIQDLKDQGIIPQSTPLQ